MKTKFPNWKSENEIPRYFQIQDFPAVYAKWDLDSRPIVLKTPLSLGKYILMPTISGITTVLSFESSVAKYWKISEEDEWKRKKIQKLESEIEVQKRF